MNLIINKDLKWQKDHQLFEIFLATQFIPEISIYILANLNSNYLYKWDKYLKNYGWKLGEYAPEVTNILAQGALSLTYKNCNNYYIIELDPTQVVPKTTAKLYDICYEINYGTLEIPPYPIFSKSFKYAKKIIKNLYKNYLYDLQGGY